MASSSSQSSSSSSSSSLLVHSFRKLDIFSENSKSTVKNNKNSEKLVYPDKTRENTTVDYKDEMIMLIPVDSEFCNKLFNNYYSGMLLTYDINSKSISLSRRKVSKALNENETDKQIILSEIETLMKNNENIFVSGGKCYTDFPKLLISCKQKNPSKFKFLGKFKDVFFENKLIHYQSKKYVHLFFKNIKDEYNKYVEDLSKRSNDQQLQSFKSNVKIISYSKYQDIVMYNELEKPIEKFEEKHVSLENSSFSLSLVLSEMFNFDRITLVFNSETKNYEFGTCKLARLIVILNNDMRTNRRCINKIVNLMQYCYAQGWDDIVEYDNSKNELVSSVSKLFFASKVCCKKLKKTESKIIDKEIKSQWINTKDPFNHSARVTKSSGEIFLLKENVFRINNIDLIPTKLKQTYYFEQNNKKYFKVSIKKYQLIQNLIQKYIPLYKNCDFVLKKDNN